MGPHFSPGGICGVISPMPLLYLAITKGHNTQGLNTHTVASSTCYACWHPWSWNFNAKNQCTSCMWLHPLCIHNSKGFYLSLSLTPYNWPWCHAWETSSTRSCMGCLSSAQYHRTTWVMPGEHPPPGPLWSVVCTIPWNNLSVLSILFLWWIFHIFCNSIFSILILCNFISCAPVLFVVRSWVW